MDVMLKMDKPVEKSLLDETAQGIIGQPVNRVEGPLKVSGQATYAAEYAFDDMAYGVLVGATIGKGTVKSIDSKAAEALDGVLAVVTDYDTFLRNPAQGGDEEAPTQGVREISYFGQPIALVVAETYEQARHAAQAIKVEYKEAEGRFDFEARRGEAEIPDEENNTPQWFRQGDVDAAMKAAAVTIDETWTTPSQTSAAMEPHATTAVWRDGAVTLYGAYQMLSTNRLQAADALGLPVEKVRVVSRYVGGGFGGKLGISAESIAAALAAKELKRPVKVVMTRPQVFETTVRRSNTEQRLRLAADENGLLTAIGHETLTSNLDGEEYFEPAGLATHFLYGGASRKITHAMVRLDAVLSGSMRAPGEAVGMIALECAMDELAEKLGLDPIALRKRNIPETHPETGIPYSARRLADCMDDGAKRFGWDQRNAKPGGRREGEWLVGIGMAAAARTNLLMESTARVTLGDDGRAIVETDMTDIGTGSYTILAQIAAEMLGLPLDGVEVLLGDTNFPPAAGSGGSWGAASAGSSVYLACEKIRETLAEAMQAKVGDLTLKDGRAISGNRAIEISALVPETLVATGTIKPGKTSKAFMQSGYGAHFAEVGVNAVTGEVRMRRMLSVFAAGRILNEKTARSQCFGGMVFGIGAALTENMIHDKRNGAIVNHDLAEYHLPVNADVPQLEVVFLDERDPVANPLLAKGIGELGISGAAGAIGNAVHNATGIRVRDYPITLDKLLEGLPD